MKNWHRWKPKNWLMPAPSMGTLVQPMLLACPAVGLAIGLPLLLIGMKVWADRIFFAVTLPVLAGLSFEIFTRLRRGDVGLDVVAAISMSAAVIFGENLAAAVVALMYVGGHYLEEFAAHRARREMTALLSRTPRSALRHGKHGLEEIDLNEIAPGDRLLVRQGEIAPVDGTLAEGLAVLDLSALTGEAIPIQRRAGDNVLSGALNVGVPFNLLAIRRAAESTYAGIIKLVEAAQRSKPPMSRLADRFAVAFLAVTLALAIAAWLISNDPIRAVAVLVIATPCPLILAVPIAIVAGLSKAAKHGILIKGGGALETMAKVRSIVIDKTGTLTGGRARIVAVNPCSGLSQDELLRLAASLDQASKHIIAQIIVAEARSRQLALIAPVQVVESPGEGVEGLVDGQHVIVGSARFVRSKTAAMPVDIVAAEDPAPGALVVAVAVNHSHVGTLVLADELRAGVRRLLIDLKDFGISRIVLATGDRQDVAESIAADLPIDAIRPELTPDQKVMVVLAERKYGAVMMIGDGVNDAPALAAADVGVAMGANGAAASAEVADVILLVDQLDRVFSALKFAKRSRFLALQSASIGTALSVLGMIGAAFGYFTPVQGALFQEVIDVVVILNALRALADPRAEPPVAGGA